MYVFDDCASLKDSTLALRARCLMSYVYTAHQLNERCPELVGDVRDVLQGPRLASVRRVISITHRSYRHAWHLTFLLRSSLFPAFQLNFALSFC